MTLLTENVFRKRFLARKELRLSRNTRLLRNANE